MSDDYEPLRFSLKLTEIPVVLEDPFNGEERHYLLREMTGRQRDAYLNSISIKMDMDPTTGKATLKSFDGIEASLICRCLFNAKKSEEGEYIPVPEDEVQQYPSRVIKELHETCREICGLEQDEEATGND